MAERCEERWFCVYHFRQGLNVQVPFIFKQVIDSLNVPLDPFECDLSATVWIIAEATILGMDYTQHRRNSISRDKLVVGRGLLTGTKHYFPSSIYPVLNSTNTVADIHGVCVILTYKFGWDFAALTAAYACALYYPHHILANTILPNKADLRSEFLCRVVDQFQGGDGHLREYEKSSARITTLLVFFNTGQSAILSRVYNGTMTVGDLYTASHDPLNITSIYHKLQENLLDVEMHQTPNLSISRSNENVNFMYNLSRPTFSKLTFTIPAAKRTAIVGPLECGKSTILKLLFRFYHPSSDNDHVDCCSGSL
ncbi:hypothetical protein BDP27DRAFT_1367165 [Rhodocollybia butyracea]|uniref:Iron-sulfur clusters transporter ATM1, mitochondrial n=1 Tax=Rhodocollybia butyracea TaxID=206335 RepID=A0A9P5PII9_9AGAR|nr:hypothetical protein BDP27DRAFT_1367165 [Rhodocollybia butyracea]